MRVVFIADAHLVSPEDANYRLLVRFLNELEGEVDALYIMGDLFDFWLGFPSNPFRQYDAILNALENLVLHGCRLVYFEGNHDFHLGTIFSRRLKAEIHAGPAIETVQGKRLYLCHGDQINKDDHLYRLLRFVLRAPPAIACLRFLPPSWAEKIRVLLQKDSKSGYMNKKCRWDYRQIVTDFAKFQYMKKIDGLVTGHFHIAINEKLPESTFAILSLGDWMTQFTYGEMEEGELRLKSYSPGFTAP